MASANGVWLVPGSVFERGEDGRLHNTALVLSPEGELAASYRKVFPWQPHERVRARRPLRDLRRPGRGPARPVDLLRRQLPRDLPELAWMGAEVVLQPSLTTTSDRAQELVMAQANAIFNQLYVVR